CIHRRDTISGSGGSLDWRPMMAQTYLPNALTTATSVEAGYPHQRHVKRIGQMVRPISGGTPWGILARDASLSNAR
ncbi:MAG: hypothetical protein WCH91_08860, partial [bacterium]